MKLIMPEFIESLSRSLTDFIDLGDQQISLHRSRSPRKEQEVIFESYGEYKIGSLGPQTSQKTFDLYLQKVADFWERMIPLSQFTQGFGWDGITNYQFKDFFEGIREIICSRNYNGTDITLVLNQQDEIVGFGLFAKPLFEVEKSNVVMVDSTINRLCWKTIEEFFRDQLKQNTVERQTEVSEYFCQFLPKFYNLISIGLIVDPKHQKQGIASKIVEKIENSCKNRGGLVAVTAYENANNASRALFSKLKYQPVGLTNPYLKTNEEEVRFEVALKILN